MRQAREIQHFIYSQHFANGLRVTFGAIIPALLGFYFGNLGVGITISLGALIASTPDSPGPVNHRRNAMFVAILLASITTFITKVIAPYPLLVTVELFVLCFLYAMFAVFGPRAAAVGTAGMLMIILNLHDLRQSGNIFEHAGFVALGGVWYAFLSLILTQFRPYRLAQQELAENLHEVAAFLKIKASFYDLNTNTKTAFKKLIEQQITVNNHQDNLREILFKSKLIVKDPTNIGRILIVIFSDLVDLFEQSMATQYDYEDIRDKFGQLPVFNEFKISIIHLANELDNLSYYIAVNKRPKPVYNLQDDLIRLKAALDDSTEISDESGFVLKKILINVRNIVNAINSMYGYFNNETVNSKTADLSKFVSQQEFDLKLFRNNLSFKSDHFRHALRLSIVMIMGYLIANWFEFGSHSYWILLTIVVILKPGFSLTKERNFQRLTGTIIGGIGGIIILILVHDPTARFFFLLLFMVFAYSLLRKNYILSVVFMTPYLLILFSFLGISTMEVVKERILDTILGGVLAFSSSYIIFPNWEGNQLKTYMRELLVANYNYLAKDLEMLLGKEINSTDYKLVRKEVYLRTANLASAFQRMITEPKQKQKDATELHSFITFNHLLSSYSASLYITLQKTDDTLSGEPIKLLRQVLFQLGQLINQLEEGDTSSFKGNQFNIHDHLLEDDTVNLEKRLVVEQLVYIKKIVNDLKRICDKMWGLKEKRLPTSA